MRICLENLIISFRISRCSFHTLARRNARDNRLSGPSPQQVIGPAADPEGTAPRRARRQTPGSERAGRCAAGNCANWMHVPFGPPEGAAGAAGQRA